MALKGKDVAVGAVGVLAGALIGAGVAFLTAPKSGNETRRDIARLGKKARRRILELADDFSGQVDGVIRTMEGTAKEIVEKGRGVTSGSARTMRAVVEGGQALGRRIAS